MKMGILDAPLWEFDEFHLLDTGNYSIAFGKVSVCYLR